VIGGNSLAGYAHAIHVATTSCELRSAAAKYAFAVLLAKRHAGNRQESLRREMVADIAFLAAQSTARPFMTRRYIAHLIGLMDEAAQVAVAGGVQA